MLVGAASTLIAHATDRRPDALIVAVSAQGCIVVVKTATVGGEAIVLGSTPEGSTEGEIPVHDLVGSSRKDIETRSIISTLIVTHSTCGGITTPANA